MANEIGIDIVVRNTGGPEFDKVQKAVKTMQDGVASASKSIGEGFGQVSRITRTLAADVGGTLSPVLGNMVGTLGLVARGATGMGTALAGATAVAVVGAIAFKGYLDTVFAVAEAQAKLNLAVKSFDLGTIQSAMLNTSAELEARAERWKSFGGALRNVFGSLLDAAGITKSATADLAKELEAAEKVLPLARMQSFTQATLAQVQATIQLRGVQLGNAEILNDQKEYLRLTQAISAELVNQFTAEERLLRLKAQQDVGAAQARNASPAEISMIQGRLDRDVTNIATRSRVAFSALEEQQRRFTMSHFAEELQTAVAGANQAEATTAGTTPESDAQGIARRNADAERLLTIEQARIAVMREQGDLTDKQRLALDLTILGAERRLKVQQAGTDLDKQDLANLEAAARTTERLRMELEQTDALAGLSAGFRTVGDEASRAGAIMQNMASQVASNMNRAFSDQFFNLVTGNFKKLSDVANTFAAAMLRSVTDAFAQMATAPLFNLLGRGMGGAGMGGFGLNFLGGGGGGGQGGGLVNVGGQMFQAVAAGGGQTVLVPVGGAGAAGGVSGAGGSGFSLSNVPTSGFSSFTGGSGLVSQVGGMTFGDIANFGVAGAFAESGAVLAAGGTAARAAQLGELGINTALSGGAEAASAGISIGTAATGIGAAVGLGLTIYGALQGPPTAQNIVLSAASGAVSGAVLGATVGSIFPGIGNVVGAVVGAIAGALAGGGAAGLGKGAMPERKKSPATRSYEAGLEGFAALQAAVSGATSLEEMVAILNANWSPYNEVVILSYERPTHWLLGNWTNGPANWIAYPQGGHMPYPDVLTMLRDPRYIDNLEVQLAGPQGGGTASYVSGATQAIQDKWHQLADALNKGSFGVRDEFGPSMDFLGQPGPGSLVSVERFSVRAGGQLPNATGKDLDVSLDVLTREGLTPDQIEQFLRIAMQVDKDRNLNILIRPEQFAF